MYGVFLDYETVAHDDLDWSALARAIERPDEPGRLVVRAATDAEELPAQLADAQIVLTNRVRLGTREFATAPHLRLIALSATGTDNVDLEAARARGIGVCNVRSYCTASVVQHTWALILALTQRLVDFRELVIGGRWRIDTESQIFSLPIRELSGRTLGIVGYGTLGRGVAAVAPAFGMRVLIGARSGSPAAPEPGRVALDELLASADVVSLHCPLTPATRGLIGARELQRMKPDALLINTARGALIDGAALARALTAGRLGGAGVDVLDSEPPRADDPLLAVPVPRLLVTPHVAWAAREARQRCLEEMAANIEDFRCGGRRGRVV
jgi:glycerate dehydrogenase